MHASMHSPPALCSFASCNAKRTKWLSQSSPGCSLTCSTRGRVASSGLKGRASQLRKPQITREPSGPPPPWRILIGSGGCGGFGTAFASTGARIPGALDMTCASPCGKTITSPALSCTCGSPTSPPQHEPLVTT
ncbi:MAG: hypothetical protein HONDAALG_02009 [Gammaproteobacteria bacterium]|nr:hypothetical protein [Gammaproteobacteria bacterium]